MMNKPLYNLIVIIAFTSCAGNEKPVNKEDYTMPITHDISWHFIRRILNGSPQEVAKVLGKPDSPLKRSTDCDYLPSCVSTTYENGRYEASYYDNKLKWLEINHTDLNNTNALEDIGFPAAAPTLSNDIGIYWKSPEARGTLTDNLLHIHGLREVAALPKWIIIMVETNYKGRF